MAAKSKMAAKNCNFMFTVKLTVTCIVNILAFLDELYDDNNIQQEFNHVIANPSW